MHQEGDNAALFLTLANRGATDDTFVAVSGVDAERVVLRDADRPPTNPLEVLVPARGVAPLQYGGGPRLELVGLKQGLFTGKPSRVTFRFEVAGSVAINVPVQLRQHPVVAPLTPTPTALASPTD